MTLINFPLAHTFLIKGGGEAAWGVEDRRKMADIKTIEAIEEDIVVVDFCLR